MRIQLNNSTIWKHNNEILEVFAWYVSKIAIIQLEFDCYVS